MPRLAIAPEVHRDLGALAGPVRREAVLALHHFLDDAEAAPHPERVRNTRDRRVATLRLAGGLRGVVVRQGRVFWMLTVLPDAQAWSHAQRHRFTVNPVIGVAEEWDAEALERVEPALRRAAATTAARLFAGHTDAELLAVGTDPWLLPLLRRLTTDVGLSALESLLPASQFAPLWVLAGGGPAERARRALEERVAVPAASVDPGDLVAALARTPDRAVFVPDPIELDRVLALPRWCTFLAPIQYRLARHDGFAGPVLVTGGAGTGKTAVALHRAAHLARAGAGRVLFVTFSRAVGKDMTAKLDLLLAGDGDKVRGRVEVGNVERLAQRVVAEAEGRQPLLVGGPDLGTLWREAAEITGGLHGPVFLAREWEQVILAQNLCTVQEYLAAARPGRGVELDEQERIAVWKAIEHVTGRLRASGRRTLLQLAADASTLLGRTTGDLLGETPRREPYRHIVVDEAQDLHPAQWRLLRAAVPHDTDDLFIAGDPHQRVFDSRTVLGAVGIQAEHHHLTLSYRMPQEILRWAVRLRGGGPADGLVDGVTELAGIRATRPGAGPQVRRYVSPEAELAGLVARVGGWLADGVPAGEIAVAAREGELVRRARAALAAAGARVRVTTLHGLRGLEVRRVALAGIADGVVPVTRELTPGDEDPAARAHDLQRERGLLYMACTRATELLYVSYSGRASPFLPS
ncbi:DNA helicase [Sphaerisporangium rufum]|uniref:DNA 3'-5' helicase n=1 Tax=Sphaerisporangium rufum TaxID=1381558 RepID=A0A919V7A5_9ACTN|nr:UvrD-helicase domain-containing protein [Sphaerisporangium rufum]GII80175.1 DNA helicase [Sphaerisporangium rufum]